MAESSFRIIVLPSLVYPYLEPETEQDYEIRKALLIIKQEIEWTEYFCSFLVFWSNFQRERILDTRVY